MKKIILIFVTTLISITSYSRSIQKENSIPAKLVRKVYDIYKNQNYKYGLEISTGTLLKRFQRIHDYLRMNQNRVPEDLKRLSERMDGYRYIGEYSHNQNGKDYTMVDCVWIMRSKDTTPQSSGIVQTKLVVRSFLVKKVNNEWKVSSDRFITEHILRDQEHELIERIRQQMEKQRSNRR